MIKVEKLLFHSGAAFVRCDKRTTTVNLDQLFWSFLFNNLLHNNYFFLKLLPEAMRMRYGCLLSLRHFSSRWKLSLVTSITEL